MITLVGRLFAMASSSPLPIPEIQLLLMSETAVTAFQAAKEKYLDPLGLPFRIHIHEASLSQLEESVKFDLIVSPANVGFQSHYLHSHLDL